MKVGKDEEKKKKILIAMLIFLLFQMVFSLAIAQEPALNLVLTSFVELPFSIWPFLDAPNILTDCC